ncbi:tyrosine-type recombinase/integrase [Rhodococcus opacus]|nr:tyrosine-type recombinase/integrase [Rhodococcus opacus]MDX5969866.1 tyrosine-type recombinase/integrase [Rhodococcus opacus]
MSVTNTQVLSLHRRPPASRTPRREPSTSNPTRTRPHTATADTRHSHATALLLSGVPVHVVSRRLGHLDVQTTLNTYAHVTEDAEMRAAADWKAFTGGWRVGAHRDERIESGS